MKHRVASSAVLLIVLAASWLWASNQQPGTLETKVVELEKRVNDLEKRVAALEGSSHRPTSAQMATPPASTGGAALYVGNSNSLKFHRPGCQWAQRINPANRVEFKSRGDATAQGYAPCKVCRP